MTPGTGAFGSFRLDRSRGRLRRDRRRRWGLCLRALRLDLEVVDDRLDAVYGCRIVGRRCAFNVGSDIAGQGHYAVGGLDGDLLILDVAVGRQFRLHLTRKT